MTINEYIKIHHKEKAFRNARASKQTMLSTRINTSTKDLRFIKVDLKTKANREMTQAGSKNKNKKKSHTGRTNVDHQQRIESEVEELYKEGEI